MFAGSFILLASIALAKDLQTATGVTHLRVATINQWPFNFKTLENGTHYPAGFCVDLLNKILKGESISYTTHFVEEDNYGDNSTGLIGDLVSNKSDVIMAPLTITNSRSSILAFSSPYMDSQLGFVMKKRVEYPQWFGFVYIFDWKTWLMLLTTLLLFSTVFYTVSIFKVSERVGTFNDCIIYAISVISSNGPTFTTNNLSAKLLSTFMWCFGLIFTTAFTANLTAAMVRNDFIKVPTTIEEILSYPEYSVITSKDDSIYYAFSNTTYDPFVSIFHKMQQSSDPTYFDSVKSAINYVRKYPHAIFINEVNILKQYVEKPPCDLVLTRSPYSPEAGGGYGFAFRPDSINIKQLFSKKTLQLKQSGELANLRRKWFQYTNECPDKKHSSAMSYSYFIGAFILMLCGCLISIFLKLQEIAICNKMYIKGSQKR